MSDNRTEAATSVRDFDHLFRHECAPSAFAGVVSKTLRRSYECPVCRATWVPSGASSWRHQTDGTEGRIVAVTVAYPDDTEQTFTRSATPGETR